MYILVPQDYIITSDSITDDPAMQVTNRAVNPDPPFWTARRYELMEEARVGNDIYTYVWNNSGNGGQGSLQSFIDSGLAGMENLDLSFVYRFQDPSRYLDLTTDIEQLPSRQRLVATQIRQSPFWVYTRASLRGGYNDSEPTVIVGQRGGTFRFEFETKFKYDAAVMINASSAFAGLGTADQNFAVTFIGSSRGEPRGRMLDVIRTGIVPIQSESVIGNGLVYKGFCFMQSWLGDGSLGQFIIGSPVKIGDPDPASFRLSGLDFSEITRNDFGSLNTTLRNATYTKVIRAKFPRNETAKVRAFLTSLRGGKAAFFFDDFESDVGTDLYGFLSSFFIVYDRTDPNSSLVTINVAGLA